MSGRQFGGAERLARFGFKGFKPKLFGTRSSRIEISAVLALAATHPHRCPARRLVAGASVSLRIGESLGQERPVSEDFLPLEW